MASFGIKRGDTAPPLEIALAIAGGGDGAYWLSSDDKPDGESSREIKEVRFILKNASNEIIGAQADAKYTGIGYFSASDGRTVLGYSWKESDTVAAGTYNAEFEVIFESPTGGYGKKRTFPCVNGDKLLVVIEADLNDTVS